MEQTINSPYPPPRLFALGANGSTACGAVEDDQVGLYCPVNQGIYYDWEYFVAEDEGDRLETELDLIHVLAHEHGHHVQEIVGIQERYEFRYDDTAGEDRLRLTRRLELQASCLAAAFLGANRQSLRLAGARLEYLMGVLEEGDDPDAGPADHGSPASNRYWGRAAFASAIPGSCNTWTAPPARVS